MTERLICIIIGYICGLFQTSYIYGRMHGIDIREYGSGNAGTTNALRTLGPKAGLATFAGDTLKCIVAVVIVKLVFRNSGAEILPLLGLYAAAGTILGHNFPFYLKFRGGKGIAATAGMVLSFNAVITGICAVVFLSAFLLTNYVSLGSLLVYVAFVVSTVVMGQLGCFGMEQVHLNEMYILAIALAALAFWKHRANIGRLLHGTENKTHLGKKKE
ncbi:MAG: glycerol-3-phosphate 1-O-acyltransferase PlsY [Lachnospiraceae bacterium]|nr:glycerol-3-phosphate 1-O-acyltransferase PlsY [Lachnospiraceae bacterium]